VEVTTVHHGGSFAGPVLVIQSLIMIGVAAVLCLVKIAIDGGAKAGGLRCSCL
jgi:hypothetical protein